MMVTLLFGVFAQAHQSEISRTISDESKDRVSITGAVFKRDNSIAKLGEAYRDPSGLIWGSPLLDQPEPSGYRASANVRQSKAKQYCKSIGARLPTRAEANQLGKFLGRHTEFGFSPYIINTREGLLPGFPHSTFWTSDEYHGKEVKIFDSGHYAFDAIEFNGDADLVIIHKFGLSGKIWGNNGYAEARCVVKKN